MSFQHARPLVFNSQAKHHWSVEVDTHGRSITVFCADCNDEAQVGMLTYGQLMEYVEQCGDVQICTWLIGAYNGKD